MLKFFKFLFWIFEKSIKFWVAKYKNVVQSPHASAGGFYRILLSYSLVHFYLMKKSAKVLHYFILDCGLFEFFKYFTHRTVLQKKVGCIRSRVFLRPIRWKRGRFAHIQSVCRRSRMFGGIFLLSVSELWTPIENSSLNLKNKNV